LLRYGLFDAAVFYAPLLAAEWFVALIEFGLSATGRNLLLTTYGLAMIDMGSWYTAR
jgi:hypothetical protein